jgi:hypothetical protein
MVKTIMVRGDSRGLTYLSAMHVESMVIARNTRGDHTVWIRTVGGKDYFMNFETEDEAERYIQGWAGKVNDDGIHQSDTPDKD